jgi:hypothetical protein
MPNTPGKTHPSAAELHNPNQTPMTGGTVPTDRSHITSGPQKDPKPAKAHSKGK